MNKSPSQITAESSVKRRKVFFISGYDPKGPGWYHGLFCREAAKQAALSGMTIKVSQRRNVSPEQAVWAIDAREDGNEIVSDYVFLRWDDIIRKSWQRGTVTMLGVVFSNLFNYLSNGILWRLLTTSWITFVAAFYPTLLVLLVLIGGLLLGWSLAAALGTNAIIAAFLAAVVATVFAGVMLPSLNRKFVIYWMSRIFAFNIKQGKRQIDGLQEKTRQFACIIVDAANADDCDEILVIGHSTGCQLAVSVLARVLELDPAFTKRSAKISFLTLGGSIAMLAWVKQADWFCDDLQRVANHRHIDWLDFSAAQDGASFVLFDPVEGSGLSHSDPQNKKPKLLSIKMFELFSKARFKKIKHDWYNIHFQYLSASEVLGDYNYFAIVAGSQTLSERFRHRQSTRDFFRFRIKKLYRPVPLRITKTNGS